MTTEETELTFVRCPNCRSLIPAIATRCRMCGAQFEKKNDSGAESAPPAASSTGAADSSQKQSRVRQRTISASSEEVEQIKRGTSAPSVEAPPDSAFRLGGPPQSGLSNHEEAHHEDALHEEPFSAGADEDTSVADTHSSSHADHSMDESIQFSVPASAPEASSAAGSAHEPVAEQEDDWADDTEFGGEEDSFGDEEFDDDGSGEPAAGEAGGAQPGERKRRRRRRRRKKHHGAGEGVQQGASGPSSASGQRAPMQESGRQNEPRHNDTRHSDARHNENRHGEPRQSEPRQNDARPTDFRGADFRGADFRGSDIRSSEPPAEEHHHSEPKHMESRQPEGRMNEQRQSEPRHNESRHEPRQHEPRQSAGGVEQGVRSEGALVGWLVSFADGPRGQSFELRAGRFFVGRQKLRANDFIVADSSVSTPHCIVTAGGPDGALLVQDLMSESGTFLRRAGGGDFTPVGQPISIQHGDTLRFGQYEMLVCLLPKGRAS